MISSPNTSPSSINRCYLINNKFSEISLENIKRGNNNDIMPLPKVNDKNININEIMVKMKQRDKNKNK